MELCTRISNQLMLNDIEQRNDKNIVTSPLSINVVLNMVAAGSKGGSLEYMLRILKSNNIDEINLKSSEMMAFAAGGESSNEAKYGPVSGNKVNRGSHPEHHRGLAGLPSPPMGILDQPYDPYDPKHHGSLAGLHSPPTGILDRPYGRYPPSSPALHCFPPIPRPFCTPPYPNRYRPYQVPHYQHSRPSRTCQLPPLFSNSGLRYQPYPLPPLVMPKATKGGGGPSNKAEDGPTVVMINGIWVDERFPLRPSYKELIKGVHKCEAKTVDILNKASEVENEINSWAEDVSRGLIKDVLAPRSLSSDTAIVLANGLYFRGLWDGDYKFSHTENREFFLSGSGNTVLVPFMTSYREYYFESFDGFKVLKIPYQGQKLNKNFSMYFFLPNEQDGLKNLVKRLNTNPRFLQQNLNLRKVLLDEFWIPKFKFSFDFDVSGVMKDMGEPLTFLRNPKDWSDMMHIPKDVPVMIPNMIQKAYIEVDEKGTEAAAINVFCMVGAGRPMSQPKIRSFVADHPFMFMIKEETRNLVFFTGAVVNPKL